MGVKLYSRTLRASMQLRWIIGLFILLLGIETSGSSFAYAADIGDTLAPSGAKSATDSKTAKPEEEDFTSTPFTEYGEFNESGQEEENTKFLQMGRLFGVSVGLGFQFVDGYRGALWQGGFPMVDFKLHYWFDFNIAVDLGFYTASHYYDTSVQNLGHVEVNMFHMGVDIKYYFDTKNLSAPISFASPYIMIGAGSYSKTEFQLVSGASDQDTSLGVKVGAGLEFVVNPRKIYFEIEGKLNIAIFKNTYTSTFSTAGLPNLTGNFYTVSGSFLFTW